MNTSLALILLATGSAAEQPAPPSLWMVAVQIGFLFFVFGGLLLLLRKLFGPGGRLRPEGLETIQEAKARRKREQEQRAQETPQAATQGKQGPDHDA